MAKALAPRHASWLRFYIICLQVLLVSGQWGPVSQVNGVDTNQATPVQVSSQIAILIYSH